MFLKEYWQQTSAVTVKSPPPEKQKPEDTKMKLVSVAEAEVTSRELLDSGNQPPGPSTQQVHGRPRNPATFCVSRLTEDLKVLAKGLSIDFA